MCVCVCVCECVGVCVCVCVCRCQLSRERVCEGVSYPGRGCVKVSAIQGEGV